MIIIQYSTCNAIQYHFMLQYVIMSCAVVEAHSNAPPDPMLFLEPRHPKLLYMALFELIRP